jgi:hypothetical protein
MKFKLRCLPPFFSKFLNQQEQKYNIKVDKTGADIKKVIKM